MRSAGFLPFSCNGSKFASIRAEQPQRISAHEAFISLCLSGLYQSTGGVDYVSAYFPADHISPYPDIASDACQKYNIKL